MQTAPAHIAVAGSVNADLVFSLQRVPRAGETLAARGLAVHPGGKVRGGRRRRCRRPRRLTTATVSSLSLTLLPHLMPQGGNQAAAAARGRPQGPSP